MNDYNRNNRGGGRGYGGRDSRGGRSSYGGSRGGRRDSGRREMHSAVCDECGRDCQVPFRPSGDKPIYCSDCFEKRDSGNSRGTSNGRGGGNDNSKQILEQLASINSNLKNILKIIEFGQKTASKKAMPKKVEKKTVVKKTTTKPKKPKLRKAEKKIDSKRTKEVEVEKKPTKEKETPATKSTDETPVSEE